MRSLKLNSFVVKTFTSGVKNTLLPAYSLYSIKVYNNSKCVHACVEAHHSVVMCNLMEIQTALGVCEGANAQTVGGMELFH